MYQLRIQRIYAPPTPQDGYRVLIDRLWPRGLGKTEALLNEWAKSVAPSTALRQEFHHDQVPASVFRTQYIAELDNNPDAAKLAVLLKEKLKDDNVTLLYAAKDEQFNHALVLQEWLANKLGR